MSGTTRTTARLRRVGAGEAVLARGPAFDAETRAAAARIVDEVAEGGETALRRWAERLGDVAPGAPLAASKSELATALAAIDAPSRGVLERTAARIDAFARAQRAALRDVEVRVPGGVAVQRVVPMRTAGCYAPGGRFPLPSSVLMTAVTARAAGVERVWVASPRPTLVVLAAAAVAGADGVLRVGGAQAIAAFACGAGPVPRCDVVVGPGNRFVTAAKSIVSSRVAIDMLAGPSELLVVADADADAALVAADLLAQAEHDDDAIPMLVAIDPDGGDAFVAAVETALDAQLADLPTAATAERALRNGFVAVVPDLDAAVRLADELAPEHLQLALRDADAAWTRFRNYGAVFVGERSAEVLGDYGAGPNHTLPTGGTARFASGLSVLDFLCVRTALRIDDADAAQSLAADATHLGRLEGLEAHARAAERRAGGMPVARR